MFELNQSSKTCGANCLVFEKKVDNIKRKKGKICTFLVYTLCTCSSRENSFRGGVEVSVVQLLCLNTMGCIKNQMKLGNIGSYLQV